ncbi:MAG: tRNA uridine-5-carboxymethylaminomethyl(34) synthesis GTPase MnmE, partial [Lachnospiraceae bacterium]|nr:tRNA uridine-5-carboxymethylaminomethyl(34) synthesis GTPase MnmE [Lachnospiraceae bacterium]
MENDTIAAIATALSPSGISIVRISGPEAVSVASRVFQGASLAACESHTVHYGHIVNPADGRVIDEVMVLLLKAPRTYTREDTVEIDCHGGVLVTKRVLEAVLAAGARLAEPGEFTRRAYLNGRIDLSQAEAVAGVISAKNELSLKNSIRQLSGREREEISAIRAELLREIAQIEATLDDSEHLSFEGFDEVITRQTDAQAK